MKAKAAELSRHSHEDEEDETCQEYNKGRRNASTKERQQQAQQEAKSGEKKQAAKQEQQYVGLGSPESVGTDKVSEHHCHNGRHDGKKHVAMNVGESRVGR